MLNGIANLINRMLGRYTIDGTYMGKDIYNLFLETAQTIYKETKEDSLDDIFEQWIKAQDGLQKSTSLTLLLSANNLQNYANGYTQDAIAHTIRCKGYEYVAGKRYEEKFGKKLTRA